MQAAHERNHMPTLLNIQSSPRGDHSISRTLSRDFVTAWQTKHPEGKVVVRDLAENSLPYVGVPWITGIFLPADKHTPEMRRALAVSDELIAELSAADEILIASGGTYPESLPAAQSDYESGYLKRILAFIGITEVEIILAGGTAAVAFGSTPVEALAAKC